MKKKLLWVGDQACGSGFGRASHYILQTVKKTWDVTGLGVNYTGDPHDEGYPIYPCFPGGDPIGIKRIAWLISKTQPDLVAIQTNPWHVPLYMKHVPEEIPTVGIIAVEGKNCQGRQLNKLDRAIFWTEFGRQEAIEGGMTVPSSVIPLGVDLNIYSPGDRMEARRRTQLPETLPDGSPGPCREDAFIVVNVNRNQHRKRLDLTIQYFAKWVRSRGIEDAYLCFHALPGSSVQCEIEQLAWYYGRDAEHPHGVQDRLILHEAENLFQGFSDQQLVEIYRSADVLLSTSLGEGWGLTFMEGMACGLPAIGGDYAAFGEWAREAAILVPCPCEGVMPDVHVMIGGIPDEQATIEALDWMYRDPSRRRGYRQLGLDLVRQPKYRWGNIAEAFAEELELTHVERSEADRRRSDEAKAGGPQEAVS